MVALTVIASFSLWQLIWLLPILFCNGVFYAEHGRWPGRGE